MTRVSLLIAAMTILGSVIALSQGQLQTLAVSGYPGSVPVVQVNGKNYVQVDALAQVVNGSLSFHGNQATLMLTGSGGNAGPAASSTASTNSGVNSSFSKEFLRAGIEEMSTIREWHSALSTVIENQYPFTQDWLSRYQGEAMTNLRLAQAAAATDADQNAASLITNEYQKMKQLSDKYMAKRANMNYIASDALKNDPLDQSIIACGKSLSAMAGSGQFTDDGSCH